MRAGFSPAYLDEKYHAARYNGPACFCGSRRTERIEGTAVRLCHVCGRRGLLRVRFDNNSYHVYLEPLKEMER